MSESYMLTGPCYARCPARKHATQIRMSRATSVTFDMTSERSECERRSCTREGM